MIPSLLADTDSNFGHGVYVTSKAPHEWNWKGNRDEAEEYAQKCREKILLNNYFPSEKVWKEEEDTKGIAWPRKEEIQEDAEDLPRSLLSTPLGEKLKEKFAGRSDYCIPIICGPRA